MPGFVRTSLVAAGLALSLGAAHAGEAMTYLFPAPDFLPAFAPFRLALAKGYYAAEGVDVTFQVGKGGADVAKQVAVGNADMGGGIGDTPIIVRANGLQVKAVALLGGHALNQVVARKAAGIKGFADLKGKKVGVTAFQDTSYYTLLGALASAGLTKNDVSIEAVGPAGIVQLMIAGQLDAISSVPEWTAAIQAAGVEVDSYPIDAVFPAMAQAIIASDDTIAKRPAVVKGFVHATLHGLSDIIADPAAAAKAYVAAVPQQTGKEAVIEDVMRRYVALVYATPIPADLGLFDPKRIQAVEDFYVKNGIVQTATPVEDLYTNAFVK